MSKLKHENVAVLDVLPGDASGLAAMGVRLGRNGAEHDDRTRAGDSAFAASAPATLSKSDGVASDVAGRGLVWTKAVKASGRHGRNGHGVLKVRDASMEKIGAFVAPARADVTPVPQPVMVGHTRRMAGPDEPVRQRVHDEHLFGVLLAGQGVYQIGPDTLPLGEPLGWFQPAGEMERVKLQGSIDGWWVGFHWPGLKIRVRNGDLALRSHGLSHVTPRWKRLDSQVVLQMVAIFQELLADAGAMDFTGQLRTHGRLLQLLGLYLSQPQEVEASNHHWALEKFKQLLEARACDNVSIDELASEVQMSADHLRTLFHQRFGRSPLEFRIALRLTMAKELLCSSNLYIKEVAHRVGYPDPLYFSRAFKAHFGVSPREVIRRARRVVD